MKKKFLVKYLSIIFILASMMGSLHHHNDMQVDNDCQICTISHNVIDIDTPTDLNYFTLLSKISEAPISSLKSLQIQEKQLSFSARAPPLFS